ncbi:hypothetical protein [Amycolatopsis sp. NPDC102389]|uniref:hypothetical protein n=1 Tax=Amycolatopsis sp. NPDC102389 TaxID=3363941 RepID=UPI0038289BCF
MSDVLPVPSIPLLSVRVPSMAWLERNPGDDDFLRWSEGQNVVGTTVRWTSPQVLRDRRSAGVPSIAGRGTDTVMAWRGSGTDRHIWFDRLRRLPDAVPGGTQYTWGAYGPAGAQYNKNFQTGSFPVLAQYLGRIFMFWKTPPRITGEGSPAQPDYPERMHWSELIGNAWKTPVGESTFVSDFCALLGQGEVNTDDNIAVAEHAGLLYAAWRDRSTIRMRTYDGQRWSDVVAPLNGGLSASKIPALVSDGTRLHLAWRNVDDDHIAWSTLEGSGWSAPSTLYDRRTAGSPAMGATGRGIVMVWVGSTTPMALWWSHHTNGEWSEQRPFTDRTMNTDLHVSLV